MSAKNFFLVLLALSCAILSMVFSCIWLELMADRLLLRVIG